MDIGKEVRVIEVDEPMPAPLEAEPVEEPANEPAGTHPRKD